MTKLVWNQAGERIFETGVDRGVLFVGDGPGVPWNGLISVTESPSGAEANHQYAGNNKYLTLMSEEEFGGTIEAFTYPEEFEACDGTANINGIAINQQSRAPFAFAYRTLKGNDIVGSSFGYKINLVFDAQAAPTEVQYSSTDDAPEALTFAWEFTTSPVTIDTLSFSKMTFDSTKVHPAIMQMIENDLYGTPTTPSKMPTLEWLRSVFENPLVFFNVENVNSEGVSPLTSGRQGDLIGSANVGIYTAANKTDLIETAVPGIYTLE